MKAMFSFSVAKYRPHHRYYRHLQDFLVVGTATSYLPPCDGYRPPRRPRIDRLEMSRFAALSSR
jgi:hypothetical protein